MFLYCQRILFFLLAVSLFSLNSDISARSIKFPPVDEAVQDKSFLSFRDSLLEALTKRDTSALKYFLHEEHEFRIYPFYGTRYSNYFFGNKPLLDKFAEKLIQTIQLGGKFIDKNKFYAPYIFTCWPEQIDPLKHKAVIQKHIPVFKSPYYKTITIDTLSFEIVELQNEKPNERHQYPGCDKVILAGGRNGFINTEYTWSPLDWRLVFVKEKDIWTLKLVVSGSEPPSPVIKLFPEDQASLDSSFLTFRNRLLKAAENKDTTYIFSILDENIKFSFGVENGKEYFKQFWGFRPSKIGRGSQSDFWEELQKVLYLGGAFWDDSTFQAPYPFANWSRGDYVPDGYGHFVVTKDRIAVYAKPDTLSSVLKVLSYDILKATPDTFKYNDWLKIYLNDGREAFILKNNARSPIDYRTAFVKRNEKWIMKFFLAGD